MSDSEQSEHKGTALARSEKVAARLSVAARKLRFSTSGRSALYRVVGLRPRGIDRIFNVLLILAAIVLVAVPNAIAVGYFGFIAADRFQSETRFTVRPASPALGEDQIGTATGLPSVKIVQDTQIVTSFMESHEALTVLRGELDFEAIYNHPRADFWARLGEDATAEHALRYWQDQISIAINPTSGIVTVAVSAFTPQDAQAVLSALMRRSEEVVNGVNDRIWTDVLATARVNLEHASTRLREAQVGLSELRGETGVLSVEASAQVLSTIITTLEQEKLDLEQRYSSQLQVVSADAPQMRALRREIEAKQNQITEIGSQIAGAGSEEGDLAGISGSLSRAQLEVSLAEQQFAASVATFEQVQFVSRQQLLYLDAFLPPTLPQGAELPRRWLWISTVLGLSLLAWAIASGLLIAWRNRLDR